MLCYIAALYTRVLYHSYAASNVSLYLRILYGFTKFLSVLYGCYHTFVYFVELLYIFFFMALQYTLVYM